MQNDRKNDDVLVIGGGVIGLACAHYLRQAGRAVRVIEQGAVGAGASHGNCGLVFTSDLVPLCVPGAVRQEILGVLRRTSPLSITPTLDMGRISWLFRFAGMCRADHVRHAIRARAAILKSSGHLFEALLGPGGLAAEYEKRGVLLVYRSEAAMQGYAAVNDLLRPHGVAAEALVGKALLDVEPALREDVYGAWYHRADSHVRPDKLLASWKQALARSGVVIEEDCRLERFRCAAGCVEAAVTNRGERAARDFVLAAGAWSAPVAAQLGLKLPMQPGKGYSITMDRPAVCPQIPCYLHERRVVATPWPSGYRLGGTMEFSGFSTALDRPPPGRADRGGRRVPEGPRRTSGGRGVGRSAAHDLRRPAGDRPCRQVSEPVSGYRARNAGDYRGAGHREACGRTDLRESSPHRPGAVQPQAVSLTPAFMKRNRYADGPNRPERPSGV